MKITRRQIRKIIREERKNLREDHIDTELDHLKKNVHDDVEHIKDLKDDDPTSEFVEAFLAANLPEDCGEIVPMLRQMFVPITAYVRVKQKMAKQGAWHGQQRIIR